LEFRLGISIESWVEQKTRPNLQHKFLALFFVYKINIIYFNEDKPYSNSFLRLKIWDFASMSGLVDMSGTRNLGHHVSWPQEKNKE
jgi:hypothetical protein